MSSNQAMSSIGLDLSEAYTNSFIVRIWLEETTEEAGRATWRGHITHVPSGERRYLKDLDDIVAFIVPYLQRMGIEPSLIWRTRLWLKRRVHRNDIHPTS